MRVLVVIAITATVVTGASACTKDSVPHAANVDRTVAVCTDARAENAKAADDYTSILMEGLDAMGDPAKAKENQDKLSRRMAEWQAKLINWAAEATKPEVRKALTDGAEMVGRLNAPDDYTGLRDTQQQFSDFTNKLATACTS